MEQVVVSGVAYDKNQAKVTIKSVPDKPGIAALIFKTIADASIIVDMIVQNTSTDGRSTDLSFTVAKTDAKKTLALTEELMRGLGAAGVDMRDDVAKISVVGVGMRTHSGVAATMFETLAKHGVNIMTISTSEIKVSCLIELKYMELAVRALHETFGLAEAGK